MWVSKEHVTSLLVTALYPIFSTPYPSFYIIRIHFECEGRVENTCTSYPGCHLRILYIGCVGYVVELTHMTVKSRHCYVKVTSSYYVPSQLIHELLGSPFVLPSNCESVAFPLVFWVRCGTWLYRFLIFALLLTFKYRVCKWSDWPRLSCVCHVQWHILYMPLSHGSR